MTRVIKIDIAYAFCLVSLLTLSTRPIGITEHKLASFLKFLKCQRLFQELMNQYQACLYLSESFFHCGSKYGHIIRQFWHFVYKFGYILTCRLHSPAAWKALMEHKCPFSCSMLQTFSTLGFIIIIIIIIINMHL